MNVLQVVPSYPPAWAYGGPARVAYELSRHLVFRGHRVTVYTTDAFMPHGLSSFPYESRDEGVRVVRFRNVHRKLAERHRFPAPLGLARFMRSEVVRYDVVHVHEYRTVYNRAIVHAAVQASVPCLLSPHGAATFNGQKEAAKLVFDAVLGRWIRGNLSALFALSSMERTQLERTFKGKLPIFVVPNGVSDPCAQDPAAIRRRRLSWGVREGAKVVLYFGRIAESKRIDLLLKAAHACERDLERAHVVICGPDDGAERGLRKLAQELQMKVPVTFAPPQYGPSRDIVLQAADVVVVPNFTGLPMVLLEAAANERPSVVAADVEGLPWLDGTGGVRTPASPSALGAAVVALISGTAGGQMGRGARRCVTRDFSWSAIAGRYEGYYDKVLSWAA